MRVEDDNGKEVIVVDEGITSIVALSTDLTNTQHLNVAFNSITSLHGLEQARMLRNLNVMHNAITTIREVQALTHLRVIKCSYNQISDLRWVSPLRELRQLWIHHNQIEAAQIIHLQPLTMLQTLVLHPNPCTDCASYPVYVVKALPWLERLDLTVVNQALRDEAQHSDERVALSSGATDCSLISLSTSRFDDNISAPSTPLLPMESQQPLPPVVTATMPLVPPPQQLKKHKLTAEDFLKSFPTQDYIEVTADAGTTSDIDTVQLPVEALQLSPPSIMTLEATVPSSIQRTDIDYSEDINITSHDSCQTKVSTEPTSVSGQVVEVTPSPASPAISSSHSSILSAIMSLPTFGADSILKKSQPSTKTKYFKKKSSIQSKPEASKVGEGGEEKDSDPPLQQEEYLLCYPSTTTTAVHIRTDGSAIAKWPNGSVAVSVDREPHGFRIYAAHKDGQVAMSFDARGVGFVNYYPSGKTLLSTTSSGDGLYFANENFAILRQWDADLNIKDEANQPVASLGNEPDGALFCNLSDGLAVRMRLDPQNKHRNPIYVRVYFATTCTRHVLENRMNVATMDAVASGAQACDVVFGTNLSSTSAVHKSKPAAVDRSGGNNAMSLANRLDEIRAAVASL